MTETTKTQAAAAAKPAVGALSRKKLRATGRKKRAKLLQSDKEFAKTFFAAKSKRSADKKAAFRKKKKNKK